MEKAVRDSGKEISDLIENIKIVAVKEGDEETIEDFSRGYKKSSYILPWEGLLINYKAKALINGGINEFDNEEIRVLDGDIVILDAGSVAKKDYVTRIDDIYVNSLYPDPKLEKIKEQAKKYKR